MNRYRMVIALALLLAVNAFVLVGVAYNRSGAPDAEISLTERELPLAWSRRADENSGVALTLNWHQHDAEWSWFDRQKLLELGFDGGQLDDPDNLRRRYRTLPVRAYAVLEYEGPAWQEYLAGKRQEQDGLEGQVAAGKMTEEAAARRRKELTVEMRVASRLLAVDVGADPESLRARYPDRSRYLIAPAEVRAVATWPARKDGEKPQRSVHGRIERILTGTIHLPRQFHAQLEQIPDRERLHANRGYYNADDTLRPHYRVRLAAGQRYEPWIVAIEPLAAEALQ